MSYYVRERIEKRDAPVVCQRSILFLLSLTCVYVLNFGTGHFSVSFSTIQIFSVSFYISVAIIPLMPSVLTLENVKSNLSVKSSIGICHLTLPEWKKSDY